MSRDLGPLFEHGAEPFERAVNDLKAAAAPLVRVTMAPEPTPATTPSWAEDKFGWCLWYLNENGHLYVAFREAADALFERHPTARTSAETILQHLRYLTPATAEGDPFKINNNARSLFARLYLVERPQYRDQFERRTSHLDLLSGSEKWALVRAAEAAAEANP